MGQSQGQGVGRIHGHLERRLDAQERGDQGRDLHLGRPAVADDGALRGGGSDLVDHELASAGGRQHEAARFADSEGALHVDRGEGGLHGDRLGFDAVEELVELARQGRQALGDLGSRPCLEDPAGDESRLVRYGQHRAPPQLDRAGVDAQNDVVGKAIGDEIREAHGIRRYESEVCVSSVRYLGPPMTDAVAILVAAGSSTRMREGSDEVQVRKPWLELAGEPILLHALRAFDRAPSVARLVVVAHPDDFERIAGLAIEKPLVVVPGGATRAHSVRNGLEVASDLALVAIHDAARPLITVELVERTLEAARRGGAALPCLPVVDTLKRVVDERATETVPRAELWRAQTPQCFDAARLLELVRTKPDDGVTDDASLWERHVGPVAVVPGDERNFKITRPADLRRARLEIE